MNTQAAIDEFLQSRQARKLSVATIQWYKQRLRPFATSNPDLPKEPGSIEAFLATRHGEPETIHADFRALRALFKFRTERYGVSNPMVTIKPPRCPRKVMATLEPGEQLRLLVAAGLDVKAKAIVTLLTDTGIRTSEALRLRRQDIKTRTLIVRGKSGQHEVAMSEETRRLLLTLINDSKDEYVFHGRKGVLSRHGMYKILRQLYEKAGIPGPKLGGHRLRHAFGKAWLVNGGDLRSLQLLMGHAYISTTEKYCSLTMNDTIAKHERFTPLRSIYAAQQVFLDTNVVTNEIEEEIPVARNERREDVTCVQADYHSGVRCSR